MIYLRNVLANHQIEVAQFYFNRQAYVAAANRASMVVEHYQGAPVVPDALVIMVKSYHQLRQTDLENQAMQVLSYNYPDSIYAREVSGKEINSQKVMIVSKQEKPLPPEPKQVLAPPKHAPVTTSYQTNGSRGSTTTVADIVKEMRKSGWIKPSAHPLPNTVGAAAAQAQPQAAAKAKSSSKLTLGDMWNKIGGTNFFSKNSKADNSLNDAIDSTPTPASQQVAQNTNGDRR
jgi:hypothetical protein